MGIAIALSSAFPQRHVATILYVGTHGVVDPTRATLPFVLALGALQAGHEPQIALLTKAAWLARASLAEQIGVGFPPLRELLPQLRAHPVPVFVGGPCAAARGVIEADLEGTGARFIDAADFARIVAQADRVVSI
jgi:predicted peroxiredoxin